MDSVKGEMIIGGSPLQVADHEPVDDLCIAVWSINIYPCRCKRLLSNYNAELGHIGLCSIRKVSGDQGTNKRYDCHCPSMVTVSKVFSFS